MGKYKARKDLRDLFAQARRDNRKGAKIVHSVNIGSDEYYKIMSNYMEGKEGKQGFWNKLFKR